MNITDRPTARKLVTRSGAITCVVLHTTGDTNLDAVLRYYESPDGLQPHYVVGLDGEVYRLATEDKIAYHCAIVSGERFAYEAGFAYWCSRRWDAERGEPVAGSGLYPGYVQWVAQWRPRFQSPLDLVSGAHPNLVSVGIELLQPTDSGPQIFTDAQYATAAELVADVASRNRFVLDRDHVLGHADCSPMRRCGDKGPWDPGKTFAYDRILGDA